MCDNIVLCVCRKGKSGVDRERIEEKKRGKEGGKKEAHWAASPVVHEPFKGEESQVRNYSSLMDTGLKSPHLLIRTCNV